MNTIASSLETPTATPAPVSLPVPPPPLLATRDVSVWYGNTAALRRVSIGLRERAVTAFIGPSGCGKSTLLRCFNRMNELVEGARTEGSITLAGHDIHGPDVDVVELRRRVGMVFQKANPFPKSIYDNVAYGLRLRGRRARGDLDDAVERSLRAADLWDELKDRLGQHAPGLSAGEQQRLCIARAIAVQPDVLLMDEPTSALDPVASARIEELIRGLRRDYTIVIVTHNLQQAIRISDDTAFFYLGELVEFDSTTRLFTDPAHQRTEDYVTGRFG